MSTALSQASGKRLNRARDFFGDPAERWNNYAKVQRSSLAENYLAGEVALILDCDVSGAHFKYRNHGGSTETVEMERSSSHDWLTLLVFKATTSKCDRLKNWEQQLMLVHDVQIVERPEEVIPSAVGLYLVNKKLVNTVAYDSIFQSQVNALHKFLPRIADWKHCSACWFDGASNISEIQCTPEIVQGISNNQSRVIRGKVGQKLDYQVLLPSRILLDSERVRIWPGELLQERVKFKDVLFGPLNL